MYQHYQAAGRATIYEPPADDKVNFVPIPDSKPRGRTGPRPANEPIAAPATSAIADLAPVLMSVVTKQAIDMMASSSRRRSVSPHTPRRPRRYSVSPHTPCRSRRSRSPSRRHRRHSASPRSSPAPSSPIPPKAQELRSCLVALRDQEEIDLLHIEDTLAADDYTPDVLSMVSAKELSDVTGVAKGRILKLQRFAEKWSALLEKKRRYRG